ncbi:N-acetylgalactosaminyltransferase 7 [Bagarius yarrelli]|uniref:Protein-UDP acetylgalactosaminyltransferase 7 n=1 Tax=Bagarius yarrelli TaxID=175774 RepID=A0A556V6V7_BAGYA|nr:N-acetylgalactosaminyltransferase 7 [Bagarius yarrelli]
MRTVHSVIKRTPPKYLAEIVMIDDFSNKGIAAAHTGYTTVCTVPLIDYIDGNDYTIEPQQGGDEDGLARGAWDWSLLWKRVPLSSKEKMKRTHKTEPYRTVCTVPLIDSISGQTYDIIPQAGGDEDGFARGAWDWSMLWKRVPLSKREKDMRLTKTEPYRSPAMAGGLFAIERDYFFELGLYDPGLQIWGGENFEISYKCGGQLLFTPCSRVGHIYRMKGWDGNPPPAHVGSSPTLKNYVRVVEVWWDEYKDYFYASRPETLTLAYGDISALKKFREEHRCKSFKWFMEEIAYDIPTFYPLPPKNVEWGEIRGFDTSYCIDSMGHTNGGTVEIGPCHRMGGNQLFRLNEANQLMQYDQCLTKGAENTVIITHCNLKEFTEWRYFKCFGDPDSLDASSFNDRRFTFVFNSSRLDELFQDLHRFMHIPTGKCLDRSDVLHTVFISDCDHNKSTQKWEMNNIVAV